MAYLKRKMYVPRWKKEIDDKLLQLVLNGDSLRSICEELKCYPMEVIIRLRQLSSWEIPYKNNRVSDMWRNQDYSLNDIYKERGQRWTNKDIAIARMEFQHNRLGLDDIGERLNRSAKSVLYKLDEIFDSIAAKNELFEEAKIPLNKIRIVFSANKLPQN